MRISLHPNPATDYIRFIGLVSQMRLQLLDAEGDIVLDQVIDPDNKIVIDQLKSGSYAYLLFDEVQGFAGKFLKI